VPKKRACSFPRALWRRPGLRLLLAGSFVAGLHPPGAAALDATSSAEQISECAEQNVPNDTSVQAIEFVATDRRGQEAIPREARVWGKRDSNRDLRSLTVFLAPPDARGTAYLMIERKNSAADTHVYSDELRKWKRMSGRATAGEILGTDFSAEEFARLQHIRQPEQLTRLPDSEIEGVPVYVIESGPEDAANSQYTRILTYYSQDHCVALRTEYFEKERIRKRLVATPSSVRQAGGAWIAFEQRMTDVRDGTYTRFLIHELEVDVEIEEHRFQMRGAPRSR